VKQLFVFLVIVGFMTPSLVLAGSPVYIDEVNPNIAIDFLVGGDGRGEVGIPGLSRGDLIYIEIVVTSGDGVNVMILDNVNYHAMIDSQAYTYIAQYLHQTSLSTAVSVPSPGEWYVVFRNPSGECRVQGSVTVSFFETRMFNNIMIYISVFAAAAIIGGIFWRGREIRKRSNSSSSDPASETFLE
jgi:hypothetical protein